jgi:hypothetical protein
MIWRVLGKTTLPERAVDTWTAAYLVSQLPQIALWAPTQNTHLDFDFSLSGDGKLFVLEQKAPVLHKPQQNHHIQINVGYARQLWRYCTDPDLVGLVWYVLPVPPYDAALAAGRGSSLLPDIAGARVAGHPWPEPPAQVVGHPTRGLPCEDWFYLVPARDLYTWLSKRHTPGHMPPLPRLRQRPPANLVGKRSFPCADFIKNPPSNSMTLREWVAALTRCDIEGGLVRRGQVVRAGRISQEGEVVDLGRKVRIPLQRNPEVRGSRRDKAPTKRSSSPGSTRAIFVPRAGIHGWARQPD